MRGPLARSGLACHHAAMSSPLPSPLPKQLFDRVDPSADSEFYAVPRMVTHIDDATIDAITALYREKLAAGCAVLDLMSSWVSHLPEDIAYDRVAGLGMNEAELAANPRLTEWVVHDLNATPALPYEDASFDAVVNAVSVQYLTDPVAVFAQIARVLRPGGLSIVAMSHRCFPTKAIRAFHEFSGPQPLELVEQYHSLSGGFDTVERLDRSPSGADPLWVVVGRRADPPRESEKSNS